MLKTSSRHVLRTSSRPINVCWVNTSKLALKSDFASLRAEVDKRDIDKLKDVPIKLSNLKSKVDKLEIGKLETTPVRLSKLSNVVKMMLLKKMHIMLRSKILKIK